MQNDSSCQGLDWVTAHRVWSAEEFPWQAATGKLHSRGTHDACPETVQPILAAIITALGGILAAVVAGVLAFWSGDAG